MEAFYIERFDTPAAERLTPLKKAARVAAHLPIANRLHQSDDQFVLVGVCDGVVVLGADEVEGYLQGMRVSCRYFFSAMAVILILNLVAWVC